MSASALCVRDEGCAFADNQWMCAKSCYAKWSRELSEKHDREEAERTARGVFRGCPICKQRVLNQCYHDGQDVPSRDIPLEEERVPINRTELIMAQLTKPFTDVRAAAERIEEALDEAESNYWMKPKP